MNGGFEVEPGTRICATCKHKGNYEEMAGNRILTYCAKIGSQVFMHNEGECWIWEQRDD